MSRKLFQKEQKEMKRIFTGEPVEKLQFSITKQDGITVLT